MSPTDTKSQILDAAEALFAEQGFAATSLRELTARAGVNLAAVNYHFGSKDELALEVLRRRIGPINAERVRRLDSLAAPYTVEAVVRAFVEPPLRSMAPTRGPDGELQTSHLCRIFGRLTVEQPPFLRGLVGEQFRALGSRFVAMLGEACPGTDAPTLWWRMHFAVGAMAHTMQSAELLGELSDRSCDPRDHEAILEQLVAFVVGGFAAAPPAAPGKKGGGREKARRTRENRP